MDDQEPADWTLEEHLAAGSIALAQIEADKAHAEPEPICHHFSEIDPVDPEEVSVEATFAHLVPRFSALGLEFAADRLEAWEVATPSAQWLKTRVPAVLDAASGSGLHYLGWTWEPRGRQPIGASDVQVINNRSA